jgi:pantetheine-phosphate adenylyltransferase
MHKVVCPGSFDPITNGHLDIITRAASLFDEVIVLVSVNENKRSMFSVAERVTLIEEAVAGLANVRAGSHHGLLVDFCVRNGVGAIVKGLRAVSDFDVELQMAQMNGSLADVDTVFIPTSAEYSFLASSLVKDVARHGGEVSGLVPANVLLALKARVTQMNEAEEGSR